MKIYKYFLLLVLYTMSCEQPYVESSNSSSFSGKFKTNRDWWPNQLDLSVLRKHSSHSDPMGENFSYRESFSVYSAGILSYSVYQEKLSSFGILGNVFLYSINNEA